MKTINHSILINLLAVPKMCCQLTNQLMSHFGPEVNPIELSEAEQKVMENLGSDPVHIDQLENQMEITSLQK